jgi:hypothetical protein
MALAPEGHELLAATLDGALHVLSDPAYLADAMVSVDSLLGDSFRVGGATAPPPAGDVRAAPMPAPDRSPSPEAVPEAAGGGAAARSVEAPLPSSLSLWGAMAGSERRSRAASEGSEGSQSGAEEEEGEAACRPDHMEDNDDLNAEDADDLRAVADARAAAEAIMAADAAAAASAVDEATAAVVAALAATAAYDANEAAEAEAHAHATAAAAHAQPEGLSGRGRHRGGFGQGREGRPRRGGENSNRPTSRGAGDSRCGNRQQRHGDDGRGMRLGFCWWSSG